MITVLVAIRKDGSVRAVLSDTQEVRVVIDRTDMSDPPQIMVADWSPTIVADRAQEAEVASLRRAAETVKELRAQLAAYKKLVAALRYRIEECAYYEDDGTKARAREILALKLSDLMEEKNG